jgi:hypothetical protein
MRKLIATTTGASVFAAASLGLALAGPPALAHEGRSHKQRVTSPATVTPQKEAAADLLAAAVAAGKLTTAQATTLLSSHSAIGALVTSDLAGALGTSVPDLKNALASGETLGQIAQANNVDLTQVVAALIAAAQKVLGAQPGLPGLLPVLGLSPLNGTIQPAAGVTGAQVTGTAGDNLLDQLLAELAPALQGLLGTHSVLPGTVHTATSNRG